MLITEKGKHKRARAKRDGLLVPGGDTAGGGNMAKPNAPPAACENSAWSHDSFPIWAALAFSPAHMDEDYCRKHVIEWLHGGNAACPSCGLQLEGATLASFRGGKRCHCGRCGRWFNARSGTFLANAELSYSQVFLLAALIPTGLTPAQIADFVCVSADTVRIWIKRFKAFDY